MITEKQNGVTEDGRQQALMAAEQDFKRGVALLRYVEAQLRCEVETLQARVSELASEKDQAIIILRSKMNELASEKEETIAALRFEMSGIISEKDQAIATLRSKMNELASEKDETIAMLQLKVSKLTFEKDAAHESASKQAARISQLRAQLDTVINSTSWRITAPLRAGLGHFPRLARWLRWILRLVLRLLRHVKRTISLQRPPRLGKRISEGSGPDPQPSFHRELSVLRERLFAETTKMSARVTVIIPCYNYGIYVREAVDSALNQMYPHVDVIVVDDGSSDSQTLEVLAGIRHPRVRIHRQTNQGLSNARNNGAKLSDSDFLIFLDADDRLVPEAVAILLLELAAHPEAAYAYSYQRFFGDQELVWACQDYNAYDLLWRNHPSVCSLIRAEVFRNSPGYRPEMLYGQEDWEHWLALSTLDAFGHCVPMPLFEHRRHGVTMTHTAQGRQSYLAAMLRRLNEKAYSPAAILQRKVEWRPTVSVVIPFYNRTEFLSETLDSLAAQSINDFEIVLVNDGSDSPHALALLHKLRCDPRLRVIDCPHRGPAASRNAGVAAARSEHIYFLDSDDLVDATTLEKLSLMAVLHPRVAFFYTGVVHFGSIDAVCIEQFDRKRLLRENFLTVSALIRRDVYLEVGGNDESLIDLYEDYDFWLRVIERGHKGMLLPEPLFRYRRHSASLSHERSDLHEEKMRRLRARHPGLFGGEPVDRSSWQLMSSTCDRCLPITRAFADLFQNSSGVPYESWRLPNTPAPFHPRHWRGERLNILYLIPFCVVGGAERVDLNILASLPKERFHVTVVMAKDASNEWLSEFSRLADEIFFLPHFFASREQVGAVLLYLCISRNVDLIFNRNTSCGYALGEIIKQISTTVAVADLVHLHNSGLDWLQASTEFHSHLDSRIVISNHLRRYAAVTYHLPVDDFTVIRNGIQVTRALSKSQVAEASKAVRNEFNIPPNACVIGFVGRLDDQKDPIRWIEAAALIGRRLPTAHFIMVGDGELGPTVDKVIRRLKLTDRIHRTGYQADVDRFYASMTLLLLTSKYEGIPLVVLEAMLQGVPALSTNVGAIAECIDDTVGALFPVDATAHAIADVVVTFLRRLDSDRLLPVRCRERIEELFALNRMQDAYRAKFEQLCSKRDIDRRLSDYQTWMMSNLPPW